ncbi:MAG: hypothetical protein IJZ32_01960 [Clostridia bacterium]|nr:hypothetical protein [Clostridia bacterium]
MTENFSKFKRKHQIVRILKSLMAGVALGAFFGGIFLIASKSNFVGFCPIFALLIGAGVFLLSGTAVYFILHISDKKLAQDLDERFALQEKVQTMIAYRNDSGDLLDLQRLDTEETLADIPARKFKPKYLWAYFLALCIGFTSLAFGFAAKDKRKPVEKVEPFEISAMQIAGLEELIKYVDHSEMEEVYRVEISSDLTDLLGNLKAAKTEPQMQAALTESMAYIQATTYESSSMTEILNAFWNTQEPYAQGFAKTLDTSSWKEPNWGDFTEKLTEFCNSFHYQATEENETPTDAEKLNDLQSKLEYFTMKADMAFLASGMAETDPLYSVLYRFINEDQESAISLSAIAQSDTLTTYEQAISELENTFIGAAEDMYAVTAQQKINTNVGEYTMEKLATLFLVPVPPFEHPDFSKTNDNSGSSSDNNDGDQPSDGGVGEGAVYGSKDLVLDPDTGEYVEYGTLLDKYYAIMYEKLENGNYTEKQKEIIKNYFALLYSGMDNEEGN